MVQKVLEWWWVLVCVRACAWLCVCVCEAALLPHPPGLSAGLSKGLESHGQRLFHVCVLQGRFAAGFFGSCCVP